MCGIHGHERGLQRILAAGLARALALLDRGERESDRILCRFLHVEIDCRVDLQSALIDAIPSEALDEESAHFLLEVLTERLASSQAVVEHDRLA